MNNTHQYQLIDGTFTPDQARQILGSMVKSKIDFHSILLHSENERAEPSGLHPEERLLALRDLDEKIKAVIESARDAGKNLELKGGFEITLKDA